MKRKMILTLGILVVSYFLHLPGSAAVLDGGLFADNISYVYAQNQDVKYEYDSLGRVSTARYPDGTVIKYQYDANGNLLYSKKSEKQTPPNGSSQSGGSTQQSNSSGGSTQQNNGSTGNANSGSEQIQKPSSVTASQHYTATDMKNYNQFKKKKPVIKSLKKSTSKKKYYLTIKIKQVKKRGIYGETGYQIRYATNKKFKKAKTIKITRSKKSSITSKKWKVKKGKTYYVKVRAMMKTKTGKTIYSKYSKVKSIKVK